MRSTSKKINVCPVYGLKNIREISYGMDVPVTVD